MTRREAREQAFILIFEKSFQIDTDIEELVDFASENGLFVADEYSVNLSKSVYENVETIDGHIIENIKGRSFSRLSKVSKAILRMAICEILFIKDVPESVAINEAVEISKKYASDEEPKYINGVLGSFSRSMVER